MEQTKTNKILIGIVILLLLFVSLQTCKGRDSKPVVKEVITIDTTHVSYIDTIPFYNIIDSIRWVNLPVIDSSANEDGSEFTYVTDITDSLIAGTVHTVVESDGTLVTQNLTYLPKFPKYITSVDTFWINKEKTITIEEPDWGIYAGAMVSPYMNLSVIGTLGLKTKKDMYFGIGYEPFRQNVYLDFKIKLFNKK